MDADKKMYIKNKAWENARYEVVVVDQFKNIMYNPFPLRFNEIPDLNKPGWAELAIPPYIRIFMKIKKHSVKPH